MLGFNTGVRREDSLKIELGSQQHNPKLEGQESGDSVYFQRRDGREWC